MTPGETLCCRCALCCDGTAVTLVALDAAEAERARARGQAVVEARGIHQQRQPCVSLRDRRCAEYETRFRVCREYRCVLLRSVEDGRLALEDALRMVEAAPGLVAEIVRRVRPDRRETLDELFAEIVGELRTRR